ncbi:phosphotransferase [Streptomyces marincola]|uniref:Kinase n=1 Tax=Streptomyces marincola TaxID=2878388 RepID=A0A1W7D5T9_9ACTN|nr:phosphotransferase [Streptomyces marincola]ARQ72406.1 kinase [Streptomyces marincola]
MLEEPLTGGNANAGVVRVGDTVRRPAGPWTPAVHALLAHLDAVGYRAAPRPLGIDEQGREVLTFAPGATVWPERFPLLDPADRLARVARLIRAFHDAVAGFTPPEDARWNAMIPADGAEIIAHHDLAPWNLVVEEAADTWTFIDWDLAAPGTRLWDLAWAALGFVPLSGNPAFRRADRDAAARLRLFADAYGLDDEEERRALVPLLPQRALAMYDFLKSSHAAGSQPWARLWEEGHGDAWLGHADYAAERAELWTQALLD